MTKPPFRYLGSRVHQFLCRYKKGGNAWKLGRDEFKAGLKQLMWRKAQNSITMLIYLSKHWLGWRDNLPTGSGDGVPPPPIGLDNSAAEEAQTALLLAAKMANKPEKDEKDADK
jgi:hypothetical protein